MIGLTMESFVIDCFGAGYDGVGEGYYEAQRYGYFNNDGSGVGDQYTCSDSWFGEDGDIGDRFPNMAEIEFVRVILQQSSEQQS